MTELVALLGFITTGLLIGGVIIGVALWRLGRRFAPLEAAVIQTANVLNEHLGAQRVSAPKPDVADVFSPIDDVEATEFLRNWSGDHRPWEDS